MKFLKTLFEKIKSLFSKKNKEEQEIIEDAQDVQIENEEQDSTEEIPEETPEETDNTEVEDNSETLPVEEPEETPEETPEEPKETEVYNSSVNPKYDKITIILLAGHTDKTPGKRSPDGRLLEWQYARLILGKVEKELDKLGISHWNAHPEDSFVDKAHNTDNKDLALRAKRVNNKYAELKKQGKTAILLEIHVNAAGMGNWMSATGWSAWTTRGQNNSDKFADCLYDAAEEVLKPLNKRILVQTTDGDRDYESNFYVIKHANCVAVLTENFFQDNKNDVNFLLSEEGKEAITKLHVEGIKKYINKFV